MTPKFRVWHKDGKVMLSNYLGFMITVAGQLLIESILGDETTMEKVEPDNYIVMQYTGLKDKNGVEIYEGDIVKLNVPTYKTTTKTIDDLYDAFILDKNVESISHIEVIGNVYENPELLEELEE